MKTLQVIQHTSAEYLGLMEDHLEGRNVRFSYCRPFTGSVSLPKPESVKDGLILLGGGPWGSAGARDVPTLSAEVLLAKSCLERRIPVLGIGLGAQILAIAAGGRAEPSRFVFEIQKARRVDEQALEGYVPAEFHLAIYMRDWPVPPAKAQVLAVDQNGRPALWQLGNALGFAGHPGLKVAMVEDLVMEFDEAPPDVERELAALRVVQRSIEDALVPLMAGATKLMGWMD